MTELTADQFRDLFSTFKHSAFRLELQRQYREPDEATHVKRFIAGEDDPEHAAWLQPWLDLIRSLVGEGKRIERVRVHDEPPTDYQRWERWSGQWNIAAGETIRYMTRQEAHSVGLLPAAGETDWWLFDSTQLVEMNFDDVGNRVSTRVTTDPQLVVQACAWRDLAVHYAAPGKAGSAAA